ncbi:MAG: efflux RND transporter periplasmic adaptor subunit [bacterium]|nr:efflux RND transporter periplasmic adaptor subunit [bacterium]
MSSARHFRWEYSLGAVPVLVIGFVAWLFWPVVHSQSVEKERVPQPQMTETATPIEAVEVTRSDLSLLAEATGTLQPWRQVEVSVEVGGKVAWRGVEEGQRVEAGSVLLRLDDQDRLIELAEAEAELLKVRAGYAVSFAIQRNDETHAETESLREAASMEEEYIEAQRLFEQGVIAEKKLIQAQRRYDVARMLTGSQRDEVQAATAGLAQAEQRLERAQLALARTSLQAPFSGRIADIEVEVGQQIGTGQRCFLLLDDSRVKADVAVLEADVVWLHPGAPGRVRVPSVQNRVFDGKIHTINPRVDPETGTGRVTVVIANPDGTLMPGLFAFVQLETWRLTDRLVVPGDALLLRQGRDLVFRLEHGRALWTYVETGARSAGWVEIVDGVAEGDLVAVAGHFALAHEAPVEASVVSREQWNHALEGRTGQGTGEQVAWKR